MKTITATVTESMVQVQAHVDKYADLHPELRDEDEVLRAAIGERWGGMAAEDVLVGAELNSIRERRQKTFGPGTTKNPFIKATPQGDLFHDLPPLTVPSFFLIDGKPVSIYDADRQHIRVREFWAARASAKASSEAAFKEAAKKEGNDRAEAEQMVSRCDEVSALARKHGIALESIKYARP